MVTTHYNMEDAVARRRDGSSRGGIGLMKRFLFVLLLYLPGHVYALAAPGQTTSVDLSKSLESIDALASAEGQKDRLGGVTVRVVVGANLIWTKSYGFADIEQKTPASRDTVYRTGSITKQFTGLMLLQLVEAGRVHLADPVEKYFPE